MNVLILEDEPLIAMAQQMMVEDQGWVVVGPFARPVDAVAAVMSGAVIDAALLDCNLGGETSWDVAAALADRNIPFAFTSGQSARDIDPRFSGHPVFNKPVEENRVKSFLAGIAAAGR